MILVAAFIVLVVVKVTTEPDTDAVAAGSALPVPIVICHCARPSFAALATILALYVILISFGPVALISETAGAMLLVTAVADFKNFVGCNSARCY
jgi:hypothetical protein